MSWQDYVDNQLLASQCVSKAAIAGHDGGVWAKSEGFDVSWANIQIAASRIFHFMDGFDFFSFLSLSALSNNSPKEKKKRKDPFTTKQTDDVKNLS